jgi:hypothetical protein
MNKSLFPIEMNIKIDLKKKKKECQKGGHFSDNTLILLKTKIKKTKG